MNYLTLKGLSGPTLPSYAGQVVQGLSLIATRQVNKGFAPVWKREDSNFSANGAAVAEVKVFAAFSSLGDLGNRKHNGPPFAQISIHVLKCVAPHGLNKCVSRPTDRLYCVRHPRLRLKRVESRFFSTGLTATPPTSPNGVQGGGE